MIEIELDGKMLRAAFRELAKRKPIKGAQKPRLLIEANGGVLLVVYGKHTTCKCGRYPMSKTFTVPLTGARK